MSSNHNHSTLTGAQHRRSMALQQLQLGTLLQHLSRLCRSLLLWLLLHHWRQLLGTSWRSMLLSGKALLVAL